MVRVGVCVVNCIVLMPADAFMLNHWDGFHFFMTLKSNYEQTSVVVRSNYLHNYFIIYIFFTLQIRMVVEDI